MKARCKWGVHTAEIRVNETWVSPVIGQLVCASSVAPSRSAYGLCPMPGPCSARPDRCCPHVGPSRWRPPLAGARLSSACECVRQIGSALSSGIVTPRRASISFSFHAPRLSRQGMYLQELDGGQLEGSCIGQTGVSSKGASVSTAQRMHPPPHTILLALTLLPLKPPTIELSTQYPEAASLSTS